MASTASSSTAASSSGSVLTEESRPEAGPLPTKRGEIGFTEEEHGETERVPSPVEVLPARHPADRDAASPPASEPAATTTFSPPAIISAPPDDTSSTNSMVKKKKGFLGCLKPKKIPSYGGIHLTTFLAFVLQILTIAGTIAAWALCVRFTMRPPSQSQPQQSNSDPSSDSSTPQMSGSSAIFIHVVFGVAVLGQLLFLERRIFRLRAERYAFIHPGEMLPTSRRHRADPSIGLSPWNRPPLPTYAAALAQSGGGTGDVEDHLIAAPPPPAYGNTRGSRLLLTGFLRDSLRAQRPVSVDSQQTSGERPLSYASRDDEWEVIQDADRARQLEETLSQLERHSSRGSQRSRRGS